jgi:hypothetical protein
MVRFATTTAATDAEIRAARGAHEAIFEDGDQGLALKARTPWLPWEEVEGAPALPYSDFADMVLRVMRLAAGTSKAFHRFHPGADPLSRCWQQLLPLLGLAEPAPAGAVLHRRDLHMAIRAAAQRLDAAGKEALTIAEDEWVERASDDTARSPFTIHGGWIQHLDWCQLVAEGELGPAADLVYVCRDSLSDKAYSEAASYTRFALATVAKDTRTLLEMDDCEGAALADEVARALAAAALPPELVHDVPTSARLARLRLALRRTLSEGDGRHAVEARMLRADLPGAVSVLAGVRKLTEGLPAAEIENTLLEFAAEADLPDRSAAPDAVARAMGSALPACTPTPCETLYA